MANEEYPDNAGRGWRASAPQHHMPLQARKGPQTAMLKHARRLGHEHGAGFLLAVDDTFVALKDTLASLPSAGIDIDLSRFPSIESSPENWVEPNHIDDGIGHQLAQRLRDRYRDAERHWATRS